MKKFTLTVILILSFQTRAAIPRADSTDFGSQIRLARNTKLPMSARWQALVKAAENANYEQLAQIKEFATNKDWYMRNATLVALSKNNFNHAYEEAGKLLQDKALVVRSAAVDVISSKYNRESRDLLAAELSKPYNFSKKQSLWIRSKIFNIIAVKASADDRSFFTKYLFDSDAKIVKSAVATLERMTDVRFSSKNQVNDWRDYVKKNGWL